MSPRPAPSIALFFSVGGLVALWLAVHASGVHATVAGVLLGFAVVAVGVSRLVPDLSGV